MPLALVVEDERRLREVTVAGLRELGYTVIHADGGANALLKLERHTTSLLNPLAERSPATAHAFVIEPLQGPRRTTSASHPPTERRIARLHRQAAEMEGTE